MFVAAYAIGAADWPTREAAAERFRRTPRAVRPPASTTTLFFDAPAPVANASNDNTRPGFAAMLAALREAAAPRHVVVNRLEALGTTVREIDRTLDLLGGLAERVIVLEGDGLDAPLELDARTAAAIRQCVRVERACVGSRTREAQAAARDRGTRVGRPFALDAEAAARIRDELRLGASIRATARKYGVAEGTVRNLHKRADAA